MSERTAVLTLALFLLQLNINISLAQTECQKVGTDVLNVRAGPCSGSAVIGELNKCDTVEYVSNSKRASSCEDGCTWIKIIYDGAQRWIASECSMEKYVIYCSDPCDNGSGGGGSDTCTASLGAAGTHQGVCKETSSCTEGMSIAGTEGCKNYPASVTCCVPGQIVPCSGPNGSGYCANDFACTNGSIPYAEYGCPTGSNVKCCVGADKPSHCDNYMRPSEFGATGQCMRTTECTASGGVSIPGLCSKHGSDIMCCVRDPDKISCAGGQGRCGNVNVPGQCQDSRYDNMCPGPSMIKCCAPKYLKFECIYYKRRRTLSCGSVTCQVQPSSNLPAGDYGVGELVLGVEYKYHPLYPTKGTSSYWDYKTKVPNKRCDKGFMITSGSNVPPYSDRHIVVADSSCFDTLTSVIKLARRTTFEASTCPSCKAVWCHTATNTVIRKRHSGITLTVRNSIQAFGN